VELSQGEALLTQSDTLITKLLTVLRPDDSVHAVLRDLTSYVADVTSLTDVIAHKLDHTFKVYEQLDQVTSLLR